MRLTRVKTGGYRGKPFWFRDDTTGADMGPWSRLPEWSMKPVEKIAPTVGDVWNLLVVDADAKVADVVRKAAGFVLTSGKPVTVTRTKDAQPKALVRTAASVSAA